MWLFKTKSSKPKLGIHPKFDLWFLLVITIVLWSLVYQFIQIILNNIIAGAMFNPSLLMDSNLWLRFVITGLAVYGAVWVMRIYIQNVKDKTLRNYRQKNILKDFIWKKYFNSSPKEQYTSEKQAEEILALLDKNQD